MMPDGEEVTLLNTSADLVDQQFVTAVITTK
jgi:hypothetical protein